MFRPFTHTQLKHYTPPEIKETGSEIGEDFFLASFLKGGKDAEIDGSDFSYVKLPDVANAWSVFDIFQVSSRYFSITSEIVERFFDPQCNKDQSSCLGKGLCESSMVYTPCSPLNRYRIIKLGSLKPISHLRLRAAPIVMLQRFGLIDQASHSTISISK